MHEKLSAVWIAAPETSGFYWKIRPTIWALRGRIL